MILKKIAVCTTIAGLCTALIGAAVIPASSVEANSTNVIRLAGDTRYDTMSRIIQAEVPGTSEYVVVASGDNFPDALAAAPLAGALKAPIVLTSGNVLSPQAEQQITRLKASKAVIIGGVNAISRATVSRIHGLVGSVPIRISGETRYETSLQIYLQGKARLGVQWSSAESIIATGENFADALSVSAYAYAEKAPIFLANGAADVFLETERKDFRMFSLEERERAVELYFTTPMTTAQVVEHLGYPTRQCLERWLAMDSRYAGHMAKPIIPLETRRRAVELVLGGMQQKQAAKQLGVSVGAVHGWVRAYRKGGMAALQPKNRNSAQGNKPADSRRRPSAADDDDAEALRRRVEELELENALMREVVEVVKKDPGADLRRLSNREKTLLIDRLRPAYSLSSMTCLLAIAPSSYHYHHARLGVDKYAGLRAEVAGAFADSKGRYGYRRIKAVLKTGVSEKVVRRIMAEEGLVAHVPKRRRYSSYEGETTPAPANLVDRDFTAERPNEKWLTDITEIKARDGKVYLSPMIDCFDGKIVAYTAGFSPNAELANRMLEKAASTLPGNARPLVHSD